MDIAAEDFVMTKRMMEAVRERERPGLTTETKVVAPAALENFVMTKKRRLAITTKPPGQVQVQVQVQVAAARTWAN
ncbi:hypothetical protein [Xanthomonas citri]|uniref:hypothetical protein n=1 Tax=Xanthomonas citri TaxID=346 RepID=UPI001878F9E4|nr:hypothetical protein [Xanthomonas axonopodis]